MHKFGPILLFMILLFCPGRVYSQNRESLTELESETVQKSLYASVEVLCQQGERSIRNPQSLESAKNFIISELENSGYQIEIQEWIEEGIPVSNIMAFWMGNQYDTKSLLIGGHYDSYGGPGADDNGSGVAAILEIAKLVREKEAKKNICFAFFVNEEPPFFLTDKMGSEHFFSWAVKHNLFFHGALIIDMIGYYSELTDSQFDMSSIGIDEPSSANFLFAVGHPNGRAFLDSVKQVFGKSEILPFLYSNGIDSKNLKWSDDISFEKRGIPAVFDRGYGRFPVYSLSYALRYNRVCGFLESC